MNLEISVVSIEGGLPEEIMPDIITSAAFFGERDVDLKQEGTGVKFTFKNHCPNEYLEYLSDKYDLSLDYL